MGGAGNRAEPHRSRHDVQPPAGGDETGDIPLRVRSNTMQRLEDTSYHQSQTPTDESATDYPIDQSTDSENRKVGKRMKWTLEMNKDLYRCYLRVTEMEKSNLPYGDLLHDAILAKHPILKGKSVQNIIDQKRVILNNNRIPPEDIEEIRREVAMELGLETNVDQKPADNEPNSPQTEDQPVTPIEICFQKNILLYRKLEVTKMPRLQKLYTNKNTHHIISQVNAVLQRSKADCKTLTDLQQYLYIGAITVLEINKQKIHSHQQEQKTSTMRGKKPWEIRIKNTIEGYRKEIGVMTQMLRSENPSRRVSNKVRYIVQKYNNEENKNTREVLDLLKQKLAAKSNRLRRFQESQKRRNHNRLFQNNQKAFYKQLISKSTTEQPALTTTKKGEILEFWNNVWSEEKTHNFKAKWIKEEEKQLSKIRYMTDYEVTLEEVSAATRRLSNWKAPGPDGLQNYWVKRFTALHDTMVDIFNNIIKEPENTPDYFSHGITYLLPKTEALDPEPNQYRPITCLPALYKLFTSILTNKIYKHIADNQLMPKEQKGCQRGSYGCKEQILIDTMITEHAKKNKKSLYWVYVDYKKAFDSVPHSWLKEVLKLYKISPIIQRALATMMLNWNTTLHINSEPLGNINIRRGIFQGDSLSPLWFCLALAPLSTMLNIKNYGAQINANQKLSHLIYMDDIKILGQTQTEINRLIKQVDTFTNDIRMEMGLDKCRVGGLEDGKWAKMEGRLIGNPEDRKIIEAMDESENYKYLGVLQAKGIEHKRIKEALKSKYRERLTALLKTKLSAGNLTKAVNAYAVPVIGYSFGVIHWTTTELEDLNRITRKKLTKFRAHHPRSSVERFHIPRKLGGRGFLCFLQLHFKITNGIREYFYKNADTKPLLHAVLTKDNNLTVLNLAHQNTSLGTNATVTDRIEKWSRKPLHGKHIAVIKEDHINYEASNAWLRNGNMFPETEGFIISIQDHVMATRNYKKYIMKDPGTVDDRCRMCGTQPETIEHIISSCPVLAAKEYTERHNAVAKIIHNWLACKIGYYEQRTPYYKYSPERVCETPTHTIYWDRTIQTDHQVNHNRPDIVLMDKTTNTCTIVDVAIPSPVNIKEKHKEKIAKYVPLAAELKQIWRLESAQILPMVLGATGEIPKALLENLETLDMPQGIYMEMQRAVILATANIVRKVFNIKGAHT